MQELQHIAGDFPLCSQPLHISRNKIAQRGAGGVRVLLWRSPPNRAADSAIGDMNRVSKSLDEIDLKILSELQADGRITNVELAKRVGISPPPCLRRVRALEEAGVEGETRRCCRCRCRAE